MGKKIGRKAITKDDAKGGKKVERKKTVVKKKQQDYQGSSSSSSSSPRRSKYVGVSWNKQMKKWNAHIRSMARARTWATTTTRRRPRASTTSKLPSSANP